MGGGAMGGGAHGGGFSGHAAPGFRGGPGGGVPLPLLNGGLPAPWPRSSGAGSYGARPGYSGYHGGHGPYGGSGYYHGPMWSGWIGAGYPGYFGDYGELDSGYEDSGAGAAGPDTGAAAMADYGPAGAPPSYAAGPPPEYGAGAAAGYPAGPPTGYAAGSEPGYAAGAAPAGNGPVAPPYRPAYEAGAGTAPAASTVSIAPLTDEDAVTLVFKDGRPAEHIHNYAMTRTTLYVQDAHHQEIAMDDLDLAATEKANREAGVSFEAPQGAQ